jgi:hypothetical protein
MAGGGAILVVSGFGRRRGEDGRGKRVAILTRGMALPDLTRLARLNRRIAGGGLCRARPTAAATIHRLLPVIGTAVSMDGLSGPPRRSARRRVVNGTIPRKRRSRIANLGGRALTEKLSRPRGPNARRTVSNVMVLPRKQKRKAVYQGRVGAALTGKLLKPPTRNADVRAVNGMHPKKRPSETVSLVGGVALTEKFSRPHGRIARTKVANATPQRRKRRRIAYHRVGAVSTERSSRVPRKNVRRRAANGTLHNKKPSSIASHVGAASTESSSRPPRPIA